MFSHEPSDPGPQMPPKLQKHRTFKKNAEQPGNKTCLRAPAREGGMGERESEEKERREKMAEIREKGEKERRE